MLDRPVSTLCAIPLFLSALLFGCAEPDMANSGPSPTVAGVELLSRLGGLWSGSAMQTPLGTLPYMNMDMRAADPHTLFSRADLDFQNSLRFAFSIETYAGTDVLVFRNGGYFQGILRDTRAALMEVGKDRYRFCSPERGCAYLEALWTFDSPEQLLLDVKVRGQQHVLWPAKRLEARALPQPFPSDLASQGSGAAPFPALPSLTAEVLWTQPLTKDADVWVLLSQRGCMLDGCTPSRSLMATVAAGSTRAELGFEQLHSGDYQAMALLDRGQTFRTTQRPSRGDGITWPLNQPVSVPASGSTQTTLRIALDIP